MPFYLQQYCLWRIRAITQVLGCFWRWHEVDRLPVSSEWLTREVFLSLHFCEFNLLSMFFVKPFFFSFISASLLFSCLTFLTSIWGQGIVFIWLINIIGLSALLAWTSIGFISIRFRQAYKAQELSLSDLPYQQPFYPLLPIGVIVLGIVMCIAAGYFAVIQKPFDFRVSNALFKDFFFFEKLTLHFFRIFLRHMPS